MPACQMIIFPRNYNNLPKRDKHKNQKDENQKHEKSINIKPKYEYKAATYWKQKAFGIQNMAILQGGCGCGG